ncbi:rifin PIR protein,putative [Plasmodium sp. DRC-Itaito]|nr:rifin PIR protein,putative [Plasmodium sp. DRC-Itaito]
MKVHYINYINILLLFALPLNILVNTHKNPSITHHTQTNRSLCECELYAPANYDNDPQMKEVMQQFEDRTSQRFRDYDERMKTTRQKCKDRCDKEIQKIILKDKLEKQMAQQLSTLDTNITTEGIPTCICEKSMADKVEKGCLRCGGVLGGGVAPSVGLLGGTGIYGWEIVALEASKEAAIEAALNYGISEGTKEGIKLVISKLLDLLNFSEITRDIWLSFIKPSNYYTVSGLAAAAKAAKASKGTVCVSTGGSMKPACDMIINNSEMYFGPIAKSGEEAAKAKALEVTKRVTSTYITQQSSKVTAASTPLYNAITYSVLAILIIVLVMIIIYLVLRYRRKEKMKKKLQYIKLLKE